AAFTFAICRAMQEVRRSGYAAAIALPTLMVLAGRDEVVRTEVAERYATRMRTGGFLTIPGARHELLQERDLFRQQVLAAFDAFVPGSG
ncbi:MAG: alpha/beta hydrolase, partial [Pseudomonadota bacterium]